MAVSPDGKKMVATGDVNKAFMFGIDSCGNYEQKPALITEKDAAFSVTWDPSSTKFAVGCQDGYVCVWDIRKMSKLLSKIPSMQPSGRGAVRSVKFTTSGSVDLLAFAEHTSFINLIDARTFDSATRDSIRIGPATGEVNIAGLAFSPDSKSVLLATEQVILEYEINTRKRRTFPEGGIL